MIIIPSERKLIEVSAIVVSQSLLAQRMELYQVGLDNAIVSNLTKALEYTELQGIEIPVIYNAFLELARHHSQKGQHRESMSNFQRALAGNERTLGKEHPDTLHAVRGIASMFYNQGDYGKALEWYQRALAGPRRGQVYYTQGDGDKALEWYQRTLTGFEKAKGKEDPDTLDTVRCIANLFYTLGNNDKALEWDQRALAGFEKVLGKGHPATLHAVHGIASIFHTQGDYGKALEWFQRALTGYENARGKEHLRAKV